MSISRECVSVIATVISQLFHLNIVQIMSHYVLIAEISLLPNIIINVFCNVEFILYNSERYITTIDLRGIPFNFHFVSRIFESQSHNRCTIFGHEISFKASIKEKSKATRNNEFS